MRNPLQLTNTGPLEIRCKLELPFPFTVDHEECVIPSGGSQDISVEFDPGYKADKFCAQLDKKLVISYDDHPAVMVVELMGRVVWPNLDIDAKDLNFGVVLNETNKKVDVKMVNPTALVVAYRWYFSQDDIHPRVEPTPLASPMESWML